MFIHVQRYATSGSQRATAAWRSINAQPNWLARAVILVFVIVVALPIALLLLLALFAASVVFTVLWLINRAITAVRPRRDGRENVRVIRRD